MTKKPEKDEDLPASSEERRADEERVVHEEEMKATVGDVLQHEHVDEAVRLHVVREDMPPGTEEPPAPQRPEPQRAVSQAAEGDKGGGDQREEREPHAPSPPRPRGPRPRRVVWRHLASPLFLITASRQAAHELRTGVEEARRDLRRAAERAARAFTG